MTLNSGHDHCRTHINCCFGFQYSLKKCTNYLSLMDQVQTSDDPFQASNAATTFKNWLRVFIRIPREGQQWRISFKRLEDWYHICDTYNKLCQVIAVPPMHIAGVFKDGQVQEPSPMASITATGDIVTDTAQLPTSPGPVDLTKTPPVVTVASSGTVLGDAVLVTAR